MKAYWFSKNGISQYGSREPFVVREEPYKVEGKIVACRNGLHASAHPFDALKYAYAHGTTLDIVELSGTVVKHGYPVDKHAASHRRHVKRINAEKVMGEFARWCALGVADLWSMPPVVRQYLETGDEAIQKEAFKIARVAADELAVSAQLRAEKAARAAAAAAVTVASVAAFDTAEAATAAAFYRAVVLGVAHRNKFQELVDKAFAEA